MSRQAFVLIASMSVVVGSIIYLTANPSSKRSSISGSHSETKSLVLFCAASNRGVMEDIRKEYEKEFSRSVQIQYGASQTLLSSMEVSGVGDLYLPADDSFIEMGNQKQLLSEALPIAKMRGVVAVRNGNPKGIRSFSDLLRADVRLV
ncbi:MAG: substrate-binding domain-containing protein, partial [Pirellula sp.]